ncbi:hypothetical protein FS749_013448, partial [Ceratobasidium sp. UAMH 11750]
MNSSNKRERGEIKSSTIHQNLDPSGRELGDNDLLKVCLQKVIGLCNEGGFREMIRGYCSAPTPEGRYPQFAAACNYALEKLRTLDVPQLCPPSSLDILFHANSPMRIVGYHQSHRIPDIAIISLKCAQRIHGLGHNWTDFPKSLYQVKPPRKFEWAEVLGFAKFKWFNTITSQLPNEFDCSLHDPVPPEILPDHQALVDTDSSSSASSSDPSPASATKFPNPGPNHPQMATPGSGPPLPEIIKDAPGSAPGATRGTKRPYQDIDSSLPNQGASKKRKRGLNPKIQEGMVQCGSYAAEMLTCSAARQHAIGLFTIDNVVWVWWYDRQGAIQSSGINIPRDLPLFVVLLLVLQRFSRADWGYNLVLESRASQDTALRAVQFPGLDVSVDLNVVRACSFSLVGRATVVLGASSSSPSVSGRELVAKLSWPDKKRLSEETIIEQAIKGAPSTEDHLPKVFASSDGYDTEVIRRQLGINQSSRRPFRVFRMTIFERLYAITSVSGLDRIAAYVQCVKCHYLAWQAGVQHRDLSPANLMLRKRGNNYLGVLNDWDFSYVDGLSSELGERGATIPFLAMELLRPEFWDGKLVVEYKHDLESFMWIIYWLARCSESPDGKTPKDLLEWRGSVTTCCGAKAHFVMVFKPNNPPKTTIESRIVDSLLGDFCNSYLERGSRRFRGEAKLQESNKSRLENFLQHVSSCLPP